MITSCQGFPATIRARGGRRTASALLAVLGATLVLLLGGAGSASAHAALLSTNPAQDSVVAAAPARVTLTFGEGVTLSDNSLQIYDPSGKQVGTGAAAHLDGKDSTASVKLPSGIAQGTYTVSWRVISADTHPVSGAFTFSVGKKTATSVPANIARLGGGSTLVGVLFGTGRVVAYAAFALLVGSAAFVLLCWPRGAAIRSVQRLLMTGWGGLLLSTVAVVLLSGPYEQGTGIGDTFNLSLVRTTLGERLGTALSARLLLLAVAGVFLSLLVGRLGQSPAPQQSAAGRSTADPEKAESLRTERNIRIRLGAAGLLLAFALAATWADADHAAAGIQVPVALPLDMLHLIAMAVWLGGLVTLLVGLRIAPSRGGVGTAAVEVFSRTAFVCVAALVATGVYQSWRGLGSWSAFTDTDYGRLLLVKIGAVLVVLGVAWISRSWVARLRVAGPTTEERTVAPAEPERVPVAAGGLPKDAKRRAQLERQRVARTAAAVRKERVRALVPDRVGGAERAGLRRSVLAETGVAGVVLIVATLLSNSAPGRNVETEVAAGTSAAGAPAPAGQPAHLSLPYNTGGTGVGAKGTADITLTPGRTGDNTMRVVVKDSAGKPVEVPEVDASFTLPAKKLGPLPTTLKKTGAGTWSSDVQLPIAGNWQLSVTVRSDDIDETTETAPVQIG